MQRNGLAYNYTAGMLPAGIYTAGIDCNYTINSTVTNLFPGECKFTVKDGDDMIIGFLFGIIVLTGALLYIAFGVEKVHGILKILFISLAVFMQIFTGRLIMISAEGTNYAALSLTLYTSIIWIIRFYTVYLFLYFIYSWLDIAGKLPKSLSLKKNG